VEHRLVQGIEQALNWSGADGLGRAFAHGTLPDTALCRRLLTPTRLLDLVMRRSLAAHRLRILTGGEDVHPQRYLTMASARRGQTLPMADMRRLGLFLREGCTLVVDETNTYDPTMEAACRALQWWSRELVQVNTYLTTGDAAGFQLHWDDHDVIVVQLAGSKSWQVRGLSRPAPMYRDAAPNPEPCDEVVWAGAMQPGDIMHIPRGYWHQATREDRGEGFSLHVTFGFPKRTGVDWLSWLADRARENELFRHDILRWNHEKEIDAQRLAFVDDAVRLAATHPPAEFLAAREQQRSPARHIQTHGLFGEPQQVVCIAEFPPTLTPREDRVRVEAAGKTITMAATALPALRVLLSGHPVDLNDAAIRLGDVVTVVARVLVGEAICADATHELLSGYADLVPPVSTASTSLAAAFAGSSNGPERSPEVMSLAQE
jgi:hypothetical protein